MDQPVDDLAGVIQMVAAVEGRAIVVGESFGGASALSLALARPERVSALVILNSFSHFASRFLLRLALHGLKALPGGRDADLATADRIPAALGADPSRGDFDGVSS
jgi:pimeloyl-ACP methyl ester carboxylesterase